MSCPNCGGDSDRGRWAPGGCTCKREPKRSGGEGSSLDVAERTDYITPVAEIAGVNKYALFVLVMFGVFLVFASHGVLWG